MTNCAVLGPPPGPITPAGPEAVEFLDPDIRDIVDEWGEGSFPASDPPSNW
jgi:hypothetical protein